MAQDQPRAAVGTPNTRGQPEGLPNTRGQPEDQAQGGVPTSPARRPDISSPEPVKIPKRPNSMCQTLKPNSTVPNFSVFTSPVRQASFKRRGSVNSGLAPNSGFKRNIGFKRSKRMSVTPVGTGQLSPTNGSSKDMTPAVVRQLENLFAEMQRSQQSGAARGPGDHQNYTPEPLHLEEVDLPEDLHRVAGVCAVKMHVGWCNSRRKTNWAHGTVLNHSLRTHPDLVDFDALSPEVRA